MKCCLGCCLKREFFQNSRMKRDQNYSLRTVVLNPNCFSMYLDKCVLIFSFFLFRFALFCFFSDA
mgnify:CR=1 FL=1